MISFIIMSFFFNLFFLFVAYIVGEAVGSSRVARIFKALHEGPKYGLDLKKRGIGGSIYTTLYNLEEAGLVYGTSEFYCANCGKDESDHPQFPDLSRRCFQDGHSMAEWPLFVSTMLPRRLYRLTEGTK